MTSPVGALVQGVATQVSAGSEFGAMVDRDMRRRLLKGLFDSYYAGEPGDAVIFDTNAPTVSLPGSVHPIGTFRCITTTTCDGRADGMIGDAIVLPKSLDARVDIGECSTEAAPANSDLEASITWSGKHCCLSQSRLLSFRHGGKRVPKVRRLNKPPGPWSP